MLDELVAGKISISLVGAGPAELLLMKSVSGVEKSRADIVANCKLFKTWGIKAKFSKFRKTSMTSKQLQKIYLFLQ